MVTYNFTLAAKWGVFIAYLLGLEHCNIKAYNANRVSVGMSRIKPDWIVRDLIAALKCPK